MRCQHGEIVTRFCISENCSSKTAGACSYCLKKKHFHLGRLETLEFKEVENLVSALNVSEDKKYKLVSFKQLLNNYFQGLKVQINKSLESVCKTMTERVSHSYLFSENASEAYKKIQSKDLKKVSPAQLRQLYLLNLKNTGVNLQKQEEKFYIGQVAKIKQTIESLKNIFTSYQNQIQTYDCHFSAQSFFYKRMIELSNKINDNYHQKQIPKIQENQPQIKIRIKQRTKNNPQNGLLNRSFQLEQPKLLSLAQYRNQKTKSSESLRSNENLGIQFLNVKRGRERKVSINVDHDKLNPKHIRPRSSLSDNSTTPENEKSGSKILSIQIKSPIEKLQQLYRKDTARLNLKNHNYRIEDHHSNREFSIKVQSPKNFEDESREQDFSLLSQSFQWKQCNSIIFQNENNKKGKEATQTKKSHPTHFVNHFKHFEDVNKKGVKVPLPSTKRERQDSVLLGANPKNHQFFKKHHDPIQLKKISSLGANQNKQLYFRKFSTTSAHEQDELDDHELNSIILLLQSLQFPCQKALQYLRKSFEHCSENLTAAEYLSYFLIEGNHPKQCLDLCNYVLTKIKNTQNYQFSVHIINNKAASLNMLGRFSESIQFLQKVIMNVEKDTLYKNLADAYYSLGIIEKAILYYQKCICLNKELDEAYYNLSVCFYSQHHYAESLEMVSEAIRINSEKDEYIQLYRNIKPKVA